MGAHLYAQQEMWSWDPKEHGKALLRKLSWRYAQGPDCLCKRLITSKYGSSIHGWMTDKPVGTAQFVGKKRMAA